MAVVNALRVAWVSWPAGPAIDSGSRDRTRERFDDSGGRPVLPAERYEEYRYEFWCGPFAKRSHNAVGRVVSVGGNNDNPQPVAAHDVLQNASPPHLAAQDLSL
jgi:hypothetical protein